jgi:predicted GNAT superfamily acetyltransferase
MAEIRAVSAHDEIREAVRLQRVIWGFDDIDLLPRRFFVVASKIGGQVLGAFDGARMMGFCIAVPGIKPGGAAYLHSHMLGVLPQYRNAGVGRALKLAQREEALSRGIDLVEWTFDPLAVRTHSSM